MAGHEAHIPSIIFGVRDAPRLLGTLDVADHLFETSTRGETPQPDLALDCFAVHHRIGQIVPYIISEYYSTDLSAQLNDELEAYSIKRIHYRDVHNGNMMMMWEQDPKNPNGRPRAPLVFTDFGNARHGWRRRGGGRKYPLFDVEKIAEDDARSGNDKFVLSSVPGRASVMLAYSRSRRDSVYASLSNLFRGRLQSRSPARLASSCFVDWKALDHGLMLDSLSSSRSSRSRCTPRPCPELRARPAAL